LLSRTTKVNLHPLKDLEVLHFERYFASGDSTMSSRKPARTTRRLLKVATLGITGLLFGFLAGCSSDSAARFSAWSSNDTLTATRRFENLDYRRTPEIRRAPTPHRNQPVTPQRASASSYALVGQIDAVGHHYDVQHYGGQ
jgi:hypothetical protein